MIPFLLVGSFSLIITSLPVPAYHRFLDSLFGPDWTLLFRTAFNASFGTLSLIMTLTVSYSYASGRENRYSYSVDPLICAVVSLCSFLVASGIGSSGFGISALGVTGLFTAIIVSSLSSHLFISLCGFRLLRLRGFADGLSTVFNDAIAAVIPAAITIAAFAAANAGFVYFLGVQDAQSLVSSFLDTVFLSIGRTLAGGLLFMLLIHVFWSIGVHGNNVLESVARSLFVPALDANRVAVAGGLPPQEILTKTFFDVFVLMGGCGTSICLLAAIFIAGRRKNLRRHAIFALLPVLFNVNELLVFGLPIVLNPLYVVPFILAPLLLTAASFFSIAAGLVPHTTVAVEWTTPVLLGGYAAVGSWRGAALQLFNIAIGVACYIPFVRRAEQETDERMRATLKKVYGALGDTNTAQLVSPLLTRRDDIGGVCRVLASDLESDLEKGGLKLAYQPQICFDGRVVGVEALLRWNHESYGPIAPPIAVSLAEEAGREEELGAWIIDTACRDLRSMIDHGLHDVVVSVNASARQLESGELIARFEEAMGRYGVPARNLKVEVTEKDALAGTENILANLHRIKTLGLKLAMDDFGMGHSSILYLKDYEFDTIKIDGSLVTGLLDNKTCGEIISSVASLGKALSFTVMAEFVETEAQRAALHGLGCDQYQGYLFSPALPLSELVAYLKERPYSSFRAMQN